MTTMTLEPTAVTVAVGEGEITFETGRLAKQASGAVWVRAGGTAVLATATGATKAREGTDFFPLTVDVEEKMYAAGKIPGGFFKREGRSGEKAILTARMIDRPIRPLWPKGYRADVHCIATVMSTDMEHAHDILAINGVSAALMVSPLPFFGPVGAVRVGLIDGEIVVNPSMTAMLESSLDLIVCGSPAAITMVEAGADVVPEDLLVTALEKAHVAIKLICAAQIELAEKAGKPKWTSLAQIDDMRGRYYGRIEEAIAKDGLAAAADFVNTTLVADAAPSITMDSTEEDINQRVSSTMTLGILLGEAQGNSVKSVILDQFGDRILQFSNAEGDSKELKAAKKALLMSEIVANIKLPYPTGEGEGLDITTMTHVKSGFDAAYKATVRRKIAVDKRRPDGRGERDLRDIWCAVGETPRTHGSGLFQRGQTQVLSICTLGTTKEEQRIDDLSLETNKYYMHHYNFPPFSVGETGFMRGPKRRDIGHGALAERALSPMIPSLDVFPYAIRVVSETLESNGSSSMASVCGSTLAMMDAGVPIQAPVAGIAMGLIMEGDDYVILTDIQGAEDHLGDMDFKVAGTATGITALQMDIKITGVTTDLLRKALDQAKEARLAILDKMTAVIAEPRPEVNENAPAFRIVKIDPDQIGMVIGKGGETIRGLEEEYKVSIGIQEDGAVQIYGVNRQSAQDAAEAVESMCKEIAVGDEFDGTVVSVKDFGAFVELKKGTDGLLHVSALGPDRVDNVEDVLTRGDRIGVRVNEIDTTRGRIGLVMIRDKDGNTVEPRAPRPKGDGPCEGGRDSGGDRGRGPRSGGGGGGDRGRSGGGGGGNRSGGQRSGGGGGGNRSGGGGERSQGGNRDGGGGGSSEGGARPRRSGSGGGNSGDSGGGRSGGRNPEGGGNREGSAPREERASRSDAPRNEAPREQSAPKPAESSQSAAPAGEEKGRRFKFRLRNTDDNA